MHWPVVVIIIFIKERVKSKHSANKKEMHSVGFEPTSANTLELESSSLDRSDTNASERCEENKYIKFPYYVEKAAWKSNT